MNSNREDFKIIEIDKLNFNKIRYSKNKAKNNLILIILLVLIPFFILFFLLLPLTKNINNISKFIFKEKVINQKIIKKLDNFEEHLLIFKQKNIKKKYNYNYYNIYKILSIKEVLGYKKIRIGDKKDGGYILLDDLKDIKFGYSFGIATEISFDKELAKKNIDVFMYDPTINKLPFENSKFHWKKIGLVGRNINKNNMKTLPELIDENGHSKEKNMILKIDIDSDEWDVFQYLPIKNLRQFKYIVGEFHFINSTNIQYYNILKKILLTHQIFHIHCNNFGKIIKLYGYIICDAIEISFIQKEGYKFTDDNSFYPIEGLDYKNFKKKDDTSYLINLFKLENI